MKTRRILCLFFFLFFIFVTTGFGNEGDNPTEITCPPGDVVGYTYWDLQQQTSLGQQIALSPNSDAIHIVWTGMEDPDSEISRIRYRFCGQDSNWGSICSVDPGPRANFATVDAKSSGTAAVGYNFGEYPGADIQVAFDLIEGFGSFLQIYINNYGMIHPIDAKIGVGSGDILYVLGTEEGSIYYARSISENWQADGFYGWLLIEDTHNRQRLPSYAIDASKTEQKVVRAFLLGPDNSDSDGTLIHQETNDVYFQSSPDGGQTWSEPVNITNYNHIDNNGNLEFLVEAPYDDDETDDLFYYWQAGHNVEIYLDAYDIAHVIWSTLMFPADDDSVYTPLHLGSIYHWDDFNMQISLVFDDTDNPIIAEVESADELNQRLGTFRTSVCAPVMTHDEGNNLYLIFNRYFAGNYCAEIADYGNDYNGRMYNAEVMAIGSTDWGVTWESIEGPGQAVNLSQGQTPDCQPGDCDNATWLTIAKRVTNDGQNTIIHGIYENDRAPGSSVIGQGPPTENPIVYFDLIAEEILPDPGDPIPPTPANLTAGAISSSVIGLAWNDNSMLETGFTIERRDDPNGEYTVIATVDANTEVYLDYGLLPDFEYCYRIFAFNNFGNSGYSNEACASTQSVGIERAGLMPVEMTLTQNYPNPWFLNPASGNSFTTIQYALPADQTVSLTVYDQSGQLVRTLVETGQTAGDHAIAWDGKNDAGLAVGSGIYFYRLQTMDRMLTKRMVLLR
ncbi:MAG: T9SS type A sorting domain-containing protein [Planctomycetes bacterium]|nr:T9SS type A sorting domain-containing protein [Planctomycetota bacterium]